MLCTDAFDPYGFSANSYEAKESQLLENEQYVAVEQMERKIRHNEANIYQLQEYVNVKGRETNYEPLVREIGSTMDSLNAEIIKVTRAQQAGF